MLNSIRGVFPNAALRLSGVAAVSALGASFLSGEDDVSWGLMMVAKGDGVPKDQEESVQQQALSRFKNWLQQSGADIKHIDFRHSNVGPEAGLGVFIADEEKKTLRSRRRRWWTPWVPAADYAVVAEFPLSKAITCNNILQDAKVGADYRWLVSEGVLDERQVVLAYLAVERAKGQASHLAPWMDLLPKTFHSPVCWSAAELHELRGTTLARATDTLKSQLHKTWKALQPALQAATAGVPGSRPPCFDDLVWAHCVFWSRGQSLPVPTIPGAASHLVAQTAGGGAEAAGTRSPHQLLTVHEGIVPGLDFVNHSHTASCWWEVIRQQQQAAKKQQQQQADTSHSSSTSSGGGPVPSPDQALSQSSIRLQLHLGQSAKAGQEMTINYGDGRSNEELLLLYGFVRHEAEQSRTQQSGGGVSGGLVNSGEAVMVPCPIPPAQDWDDLMAARMELLTSSGCRPQLFLQAQSLVVGADGVAAAAVTPDVLESLEPFVLEPKEVAARLDRLHEHTRARRHGYADAVLPTSLSCVDLDLDTAAAQLAAQAKAQAGGSSSSTASSGPLSLQACADLEVQLGMRMATVSTYIRMLEVKLLELEGPDQGTGSLEQDMTLLEQHNKASQQQQDGGPSPTGLLPYRTWCAVVYRAGQKQVVRGHLVGARKDLERVIALLAQIQDITRPKSPASSS